MRGRPVGRGCGSYDRCQLISIISDAVDATFGRRENGCVLVDQYCLRPSCLSSRSHTETLTMCWSGMPSSPCTSSTDAQSVTRARCHGPRQSAISIVNSMRWTCTVLEAEMHCITSLTRYANWKLKNSLPGLLTSAVIKEQRAKTVVYVNHRKFSHGAKTEPKKTRRKQKKNKSTGKIVVFIMLQKLYINILICLTYLLSAYTVMRIFSQCYCIKQRNTRGTE